MEVEEEFYVLQKRRSVDFRGSQMTLVCCLHQTARPIFFYNYNAKLSCELRIMFNLLDNVAPRIWRA